MNIKKALHKRLCRTSAESLIKFKFKQLNNFKEIENSENFQTMSHEKDGKEKSGKKAPVKTLKGKTSC
ncbi:MAG: hypothetical protein U5L09_05680 [Bacteroidales bacterium]|nr:hypothetical protein [Bacteroidales bacterium]